MQPTHGELRDQTSGTLRARCGALCYLTTSLLAVAAMAAGFAIDPRGEGERALPKARRAFSIAQPFSRSGSGHYVAIAQAGYSYHREKPSNVAFFPLYPLLTATVATITRLPKECAALLVSHVSLGASFVVISIYFGDRTMDGTPPLWLFGLLAFGLFPMSLFFRAVNSESPFVFLVALALLGMSRKWPLLAIAGVIGVATACRPTGVALLPAFIWHVSQSSSSLKNAIVNAAALMPIACSGILGYMGYLAVRFDDPLAFVTAQQQWHWRNLVTWDELVFAHVSLEPLWWNYTPEAATAAKYYNDAPHASVSLFFANPIFFVGAIGLLYLGVLKRWLTGSEICLSLGLLLLPYFTRGYEMSMAGHGRFVSVAVPLFLVLGHLLAKLPLAVAIAVLMIFGAYLSIFSFLFGAGYLIV